MIRFILQINEKAFARSHKQNWVHFSFQLFVGSQLDVLSSLYGSYIISVCKSCIILATSSWKLAEKQFRTLKTVELGKWHFRIILKRILDKLCLTYILIWTTAFVYVHNKYPFHFCIYHNKLSTLGTSYVNRNFIKQELSLRSNSEIHTWTTCLLCHTLLCLAVMLQLLNVSYIVMNLYIVVQKPFFCQQLWSKTILRES